VIHFVLPWGGLMVLHIPGAWAIGLLIAFADALPVFGSGVLLVPWALLTMLQGAWSTAVGLLVLWLLVTLCRSFLEPKFLGKQAGASPLLPLLVLYAGLRLFGIPGLIMGPIVLSAVMGAIPNTEKQPG
jgi:predicted PurR-regulated permease PerM